MEIFIFLTIGLLFAFWLWMLIECVTNQALHCSRWAGQRVIDYVLAGLLLALGAVLLCVGGILGLEAAGVPPFATFLIGGVVSALLAFTLLRLRSRRLEDRSPGSEANPDITSRP